MLMHICIVRQPVENADSRLYSQRFDLVGAVCLFALISILCSALYLMDSHITGDPDPVASCYIWSVGLTDRKLAIF